MREKLNSNPLLQAAVIGVLLLGAVFFVLTMGGKEEEGGSTAAPTEATVGVAGTEATGTATGTTPGAAVEGAIEAALGEAGPTSVADVPIPAGAAPPLPSQVSRAYDADKTLVLLFVRDGGIDDRRVKQATKAVTSLPGVELFIVPAERISRYAAITQGVGVDRVPALVVVRPKHLKRSLPTASVHYGFQSAQSVTQAVIDAGYKGPTVDYHP